MSRSVVGEYHTRTGKVGAVIRRDGNGDTARYSYIGAWGAGSGHSADHMRKEVAYWLQNKRGIKIIIPFAP